MSSLLLQELRRNQHGYPSNGARASCQLWTTRFQRTGLQLLRQGGILQRCTAADPRAGSLPEHQASPDGRPSLTRALPIGSDPDSDLISRFNLVGAITEMKNNTPTPSTPHTETPAVASEISFCHPRNTYCLPKIKITASSYSTKT